MNLEHLKSFYILANHQNFSETAKILHLAQPTVSLQIKNLEQALDATLFERTTKSVKLTPSGEILYKYADQIFSLVKQTEKELDSLSETIHGDLHIGASLTIGEHILPYVLGQFRKEYPNIQMKLKVYNSEQIMEHLANDDIDLGFIESTKSYPDYDQSAFLEDELVVTASASPSSPVSPQKQIIQPEELFEFPIIMREPGSGTRQVVEKHLQNNGLDPNKLDIIMELEHTESIKSAVESGLGIMIISKNAIKKELELGTLRQIPINGIRLRRFFYAVYNQKKLTLPAETFLSFIQQYYLHEHFQL
ncbi:selenium metabolism-associated LysR family transcriptional regulator [Salibacterium halotolerans]|uniref:DNA-binding transcriptional regulator, LysR family n=1 Tax=Salibacterium halotolerans TaxID=1884432 RepID=A0A1I5LDQ2_9BACI|nr:selenium metabolism-associated LysR family transcriptional regulator [Salibacterium halotolerans]SFO94841.1 DNA-binding transcriptional regulator, LysR family [Salibacterium halotolerans]